MPARLFEVLSVLRGSPRYNDWVYRRIERYLKGVVWDVGSGLGDIARQFLSPTIEEVILSDCAEEMLQVLKTTPFPLRKYRITQLDITNPQILHDQTAGIADTVTCINVLEHIHDDVTALKHMKHLLKKGGKVIIFVPALPVIYGTLDTYVEHYRRYTKKTLRAVFEQAGFVVKEAYYMNMFGIIMWFFAGRILKQKKFHKDACRMLDSMVPFLRAMEHFGSPPLGQSLIMVGQA